MARLPCKDHLKGTCTNSFCEKWHPPDCLFYKTKSCCRFGEKCSYAHRQVDEQPTKKSKKNDDKSAVAILKKGDWHENVREPVVNRVKGHDRTGRPDKKRDHELKQRSSQRRSSDTRQLGCVFQDMKFLRGKQIAYLIYDHFRVTGSHDSVENYTDQFTIVLRNDDIQEFDSKWDGILFSMTKIPSDDILEGLYKFRIRESEKLQTVLEVYNMEIHQKKAGLDYHRLKTMVKRSIEQNLRIKNFEARNGNYETNAVVKIQGNKTV